MLVSLRNACALHVLVSALAAQVFIVDAAGGAGAHFTDLPAAVAAVPDGATLRVRSGSYSPFAVQGKGLRIVGEGSVTLARFFGVVGISSTARSQVVLIRNVQLDDVAGILIDNARGPVVLDGCSAVSVSAYGPHLRISASSNVQLLQCRLRGFAIWSPRVLAIDSAIQLANCELLGKTGVVPCPPSGRPQQYCGGPALTMIRSRAIVIRSALVGGDGAPAGCWVFGLTAAGGDGGAGCELEGSRLISLESQIAGGAGGPGGRGMCGQGGQWVTEPGGARAFQGEPVSTG